jgi:lysophospholipase L1-like esterase
VTTEPTLDSTAAATGTDPGTASGDGIGAGHGGLALDRGGMLGPVEAADPHCLGDGEAASALAGHPWRRFAVLGDSVAVGVGDQVDGYSPLSWCDRIAAELYATAPHLAYRNLGEREVLAADIRSRQLGPALDWRPDLALVAAGGNNSLRRSYRPDEVDAELVAIIGTLRDAGVDVITIGMFDASRAPAIPDRGREMVSTQMRELARRTEAIADRLGAIHASVLGHPLETDPAMWSADGIHGNLRSHAVSAAETIRRLGRHLAAPA